MDYLIQLFRGDFGNNIFDDGLEIWWGETGAGGDSADDGVDGLVGDFEILKLSGGGDENCPAEGRFGNRGSSEGFKDGNTQVFLLVFV